MGFMDKLKSFKNSITGGGATVRIEAENARIGQPFLIKIHADIDDADMSIDNVYLKVRAREQITARNVEVAYRSGDGYSSHREDVRQSNTTFQQTATITGAATLEANSNNEWVYEFTIPQGNGPSFNGQQAEHMWEIYAGLDVRGNDPDSNWQTIQVGV
jgi:hypothetical protein